MEATEIERVLITLIEYFEGGNPESDAAAKAILTADSEYEEYWRADIEKFRRSAEWTGLRGPEAELLANGLRLAVQLLADRSR